MIKIEKTKFNEKTPTSNRASIVGVQQNGVFTQVLVDVNLYNVKKYEESFASGGDFPFYSFKIVYNDGKVDVFRVYGSHTFMSFTPSADAKQLAVWLWIFPNDFVEQEFELIGEENV